MTRHLHVDPVSGVAGDMLLGALLDLGLDREALIEPLRSLALPPWDLEVEDAWRGGLKGTRAVITVHREDAGTSWLADHHAHGAHLGPMLTTIDASDLPPSVREAARATFTTIGACEAEAHGVDLHDVHLHEVGAADAILDVCGVLLGLHLLGIQTVSSTPLPLGSGTVRCDHGVLPVPAPVVTRLLRGRRTVPGAGEHPTGELTTPTGAALLTSLVSEFGPPPAMRLEQVGLGLGSRERPDVPNVTRVLLGVLEEEALAPESQAVEVLSATVDDLDGRVLPHVVERLFAEGALDVVTLPGHGKKGRPALVIQVLAPSATVRNALAQVLLAETSTLGVRWRTEQRTTLPRTMRTLGTPWGELRVKVTRHGGVERAEPELDDARALATARGVPLRDVLAAARSAVRRANDGEGDPD